METAIPEGFKEMVRGMQGIDGEALLAALDTPSPVSIKINRRKLVDCSQQDVAGTLGYGDLKPVPWCASGFYLPSRPQFTLNPLLHAGVFYVQEAGSMFYESIVQEVAADMPPGLVLDACAAPGGKSTSILNALPDGWTLVSNEFVPTRAAVLRENLLKWGYPDIVVTNSPVSALAKGAPLFSIVAVDAPCSGEGMMRKEPVARSQWSPGLVQQCAALQREILADAVGALLPGGILIYSTCTFNTAEDDDNLQWLVDNFGLEPIQLRCAALVPGQTDNPSPNHAVRFMPHITDSEGLFVAALRKPGELRPVRNPKAKLSQLLKGCKVLCDGYPEPVMKGKNLIPDPTAALDVTFDANKYPRADVDLTTALDYLRHNAITLPAGSPTGVTVLTYKGFPLGFVKNLGNRANNMYPKEWRIRNL